MKNHSEIAQREKEEDSLTLCSKLDYNIANAQHTQLMRQDAGIHTIIETISTAPTRLSFSTAKTRLMLSSSTMSQKRSTIS